MAIREQDTLNPLSPVVIGVGLEPRHSVVMFLLNEGPGTLAGSGVCGSRHSPDWPTWADVSSVQHPVHNGQLPKRRSC